jgi:hypothetical protein
LLLSGLKEIFEMSSQRLQLAQMRWWRCPSRRLLLLAEAADQSGVRSIVFIAQQFALAKGFDLQRIDDADRVA